MLPTRLLVLASLPVSLVLFAAGVPAGAQRTSERLKQTAQVIAKGANLPKDVLDRERTLVAGMVRESGAEIKKAILEKAEGQKDTGNDSASGQEEEIILAAWVELRLARHKEVPTDRVLTPQDFLDIIDTMVRLTVITDPAKAKVYLRTKDNYVGDSAVRHWVVPGKLKIVITKDDYDMVEEEIDMPKMSFTYKKTLTRK